MWNNYYGDHTMFVVTPTMTSDHSHLTNIFPLNLDNPPNSLLTQFV